MSKPTIMTSPPARAIRRAIRLVLPAFLVLSIVLTVQADEKGKWQKIDVKEAHSLLKLGQTYLVNTMSHLECMDHRIPGSLCLACEEIEKRPQILPSEKTKAIIFYCESDNCHKSCLAADIAVRNGYTSVFVLDGGLPAWKRSGHEIESVQRIPRVAVRAIKADTLRAWLSEGRKMAVIDLRTEKDYREAHISGASSLPLYQLHERYQELPYNRTLVLVDNRGFRSFLAQSYLRRKGFDVVRLFGGMESWKAYESKMKKATAR